VKLDGVERLRRVALHLSNGHADAAPGACEREDSRISLGFRGFHRAGAVGAAA
jgi:hypothetical protein